MARLPQVTLEQYSLRWLSKAFAGYNVVGCLTDVANLLFAMKGPPPASTPSEQQVIGDLEAAVIALIALIAPGHTDCTLIAQVISDLH